MKKIQDLFDSKYLKICLYAGLTLVASVVTIGILFQTVDFWKWLWNLICAVTRPVVIGGIFCYLLLPLVSRIEKLFVKEGEEKSWARPAAVALTYGLIILAIILLLSLVILTMYKSFSAINISGIKSLINTIASQWSYFEKLLEEKLAGTGLPLNKVSGILTSIVNSVTNMASGILFGVIFSIYFLLDGSGILSYWKRALYLMAGENTQKSLDHFLSDANRVFSGYIRGQFVDAFIVGVMTSVVLMVIGVPSAIIVGIMTGLGNLIPYVGPVVGYMVLALVCIPGGAWMKLLMGAAALLVIMQVDGNIINPRLLSDNVQVHPLLVIAALLGGGTIGGIMGMIVAVPVAALIKMQFDRFLEKKENKNKNMKA